MHPRLTESTHMMPTKKKSESTRSTSARQDATAAPVLTKHTLTPPPPPLGAPIHITSNTDGRRRLQLTPINKRSPHLAHAAGAVCGHLIFLHGGVDRHGADVPPLNQVWRFDPGTATWTMVNDEGPALAFHGAFTTALRYVHFVGGWNGRQRTSAVHTFDTHRMEWTPLVNTDGFPLGGGLSSHTVTQMTHGRALVVGRLGGLRMQRRTTAILELTGSPETGWTYKNRELHMPSRSGHSATPVSNNRILFAGGRYEAHTPLLVEPLEYAGVELPPSNSLDFSGVLGAPSPSIGREMVVSRRYHACVGDAYGRLWMTGGESFDELHPRETQPRSDTAIYDPLKRQWHVLEIDTTPPNLAGHVMLRVKSSIYMLGGFTNAWSPNTIAYECTLVGT